MSVGKQGVGHISMSCTIGKLFTSSDKTYYGT